MRHQYKNGDKIQAQSDEQITKLSHIRMVQTNIKDKKTPFTYTLLVLCINSF